ncbi:MAG TPA: LysE family translocator [Anaerolineales bacterium]|nr:LysE family translocator [Anaerolineales bacterium]
MIEPAKFALFVGVSWILILAPGPDMLYVITRGMAHGRRAGIVSALGVVCGILVHTTAAAFGLTLLLKASTPAFLTVKYLGAAYLIHLGFKAWQAKNSFHLQTSSVNSRSLFWQGTLSNVLNPKIAIFFLAFLPQFVDQGGGRVALQMVILGLTFALFGLCFLVVVGYFAGSVGAWLTNQPRCTNLLRWLTGGVLVGLGTRLALSE